MVLGTKTSSFSDPTGPDAASDLVAVGALPDPASGRVHFGVVVADDWATPAPGWVSQVAIEVDTDADSVADYLVLAEAFMPVEDSVAILNQQAMFARVVNLETGELCATPEMPTLHSPGIQAATS